MEYYFNFPERKFSGKEYLDLLEVTDLESFNHIDHFIEKNSGKLILCFLSYDLKTLLSKVESKNKNDTDFPLALFVVTEQKNSNLDFPGDSKQKREDLSDSFISKDDYLKNCGKIKTHIQRGDIYETNYCVQPKLKGPINIKATFSNLMENNMAPFNAYLEYKGNYLLCSSPERFLKKEDDKLISQPIKGTIRRGNTELEDRQLQEKLKNDPKETAENIMIVDLVRNDLSRVAKRNSVQVEKLNEIQTFETVHQLVSTISCKLSDQIKFSDILKATFPMGSMTGAPKIRAMELMEDFEDFQRGLYSGSVGYIDEKGNFDLNVVIRSIMHHLPSETTTFPVGSAITNASSPENEFDECLLKAKSMIRSIVNEV